MKVKFSAESKCVEFQSYSVRLILLLGEQQGPRDQSLLLCRQRFSGQLSGALQYAVHSAERAKPASLEAAE